MIDNQPMNAQPHWINGLAVMNADKPLASLNGDATSILLRLETEPAKQVADDLGISTVSLYQWLLRHCPEQWQALSTAVQLDKLHDCQDKFDKEDCDGATTSRVREKARIAMWQLSKTSKLYADKQDVNMGMQITVNIANPLDAKEITVLDHEQSKP